MCAGTTILDNWLSGYYSCRQGLAYHYGNILAPVGWEAANNVIGGPYKWLISADQRDAYRADGVESGVGNANSAAPRKPLVLNPGWNNDEYSDWLMAEVRSALA